jgi:galactokinase
MMSARNSICDPNLPLARLAEEAEHHFKEHFGRSPRWIVAAPGRVNLIGEHTDYNDGFVLPMAIERYTVIAADQPVKPNTAGREQVCCRCAKLKETATIDLHPPIARGQPAWADYLRGVFAGFQARGIETGSLDMLLHSNVPLGGGLSSSAALEVATATLIEAVTSRVLAPVEKALLCQKAEHDFAGVPCGIMDQFISVMGRLNHLLLLDCRTRTTELVPASDPEISVLITNTNVKHELAGGEYAKRRAQCETAARHLGVTALRDVDAETLLKSQSRLDATVFRRAQHVVSENARTLRAAQAIRDSRWLEVGELMYASHESLRVDYEVSCRELDAVVDIARSLGSKNGMIGCRMTGGGFGGCAVSLVKTDAIPMLSHQLSEAYRQRTGIEPTLFVSRPAAGAAVLRS